MNLPLQNNRIPSQNDSSEAFSNLPKLLLNVVYALLILVVFLVSIDVLVNALKLFGKDVATSIFSVSAHPFVGVFIGLLITAILQSSSAVTSMVVAAVAAGTLTIEMGTPIILGANVGTTITSAIVALGHISKKKELRRAFSTAALHDFFNILTLLILFPLEYYTHFLSDLAKLISHQVSFTLTGNFLPPLISVPSNFIAFLLQDYPTLLLVIALLSLFLSIRWFVALLKEQMIGKKRQAIHKLFFGTGLKACGWGFLTTAVIQSSSVTTSFVVPLVATRKVNIQKAFSFIVGANIGTTITTLLAALFKSEAAITIAFVHILFNIIGTLLFFSIPFMRKIPVILSQRLGIAAMRNRSIALVYLLMMFFVIPFGMIYTSFQRDKTETSTEYSKPDSSLVSPSKNQNSK